MEDRVYKLEQRVLFLEQQLNKSKVPKKQKAPSEYNLFVQSHMRQSHYLF